MEIITRAEAKKKKLKFYFTGKPCKRGNIAKRFTSNFHCSCKACYKYGHDQKRRHANQKFTNKQEKQICKRYKGGESCGDIAKNTNSDPATIRNILIREGAIRRNLSESHLDKGRKIFMKDYPNIIKRYNEGESSSEIAPDYDVHPGTILRILREEKVEIRTSKENQGGVPEAQYEEVCERYKNGEDGVILAEDYGVSTRHIYDILKKNDVEIYSSVPKSKHKEICNRYINGENTVELAKDFQCDPGTIGDILKNNEIKLYNGKIPIVHHSDICRRYMGGENSYDIGRDYDCSYSCIISVLNFNNIKTRDVIENQGGIPRDQYPKLLKLYDEGKTLFQLSELYEVSERAVWGIFERLGVERRLVTAGSDSVKNALDFKKNFRKIRKTDFYIYELKDFDGFLKLGIAFDKEDRKKYSRGRYGDEKLSKTFGTRHEAYFIEQALLEITKDFADCPEELIKQKWVGVTEVRKMEIEYLENLFNEFKYKIKNMGIWLFAAEFVPMSLKEKERCIEMSKH
tara:strand:- start:43 stop:1587 length:1545 start_codon:yes stop_codon:yes gene_type:complete